MDGKESVLGPKIAGAELGAMLGWMSTRVLGQYDLLVIEDENPEDQDIVYYVAPNVLMLEQRYAFLPQEFRLWLALHEVTHGPSSPVCRGCASTSSASSTPRWTPSILIRSGSSLQRSACSKLASVEKIRWTRAA